jgi:hypothetical protein
MHNVYENVQASTCYVHSRKSSWKFFAFSITQHFEPLSTTKLVDSQRGSCNATVPPSVIALRYISPHRTVQHQLAVATAQCVREDDIPNRGVQSICRCAPIDRWSDRSFSLQYLAELRRLVYVQLSFDGNRINHTDNQIKSIESITPTIKSNQSNQSH